MALVKDRWYFYIIKQTDSHHYIHSAPRTYLQFVIYLGDCVHRMDFVLVAITVEKERVESGAEQKQPPKKDWRKMKTVGVI